MPLERLMNCHGTDQPMISNSNRSSISDELITPRHDEECQVEFILVENRPPIAMSLCPVDKGTNNRAVGPCFRSFFFPCIRLGFDPTSNNIPQSRIWRVPSLHKPMHAVIPLLPD
jgi:hypothetical protein